MALTAKALRGYLESAPTAKALRWFLELALEGLESVGQVFDERFAYQVFDKMFAYQVFRKMFSLSSV